MTADSRNVDLLAELAEAELAMDASDRALRTHGHQGITWVLAQYDAQRLKELRAAVAKAEGRA